MFIICKYSRQIVQICKKAHIRIHPTVHLWKKGLYVCERRCSRSMKKGLYVCGRKDFTPLEEGALPLKNMKTLKT
jgi:hypothetical protein